MHTPGPVGISRRNVLAGLGLGASSIAAITGVAITPVVGSALAGVGGAFLSLYYTGDWNEGLASGRGPMAVFSRSNPINCIYASLLFGAAGTLGP